jgi:hypothetical protein
MLIFSADLPMGVIHFRRSQGLRFSASSGFVDGTQQRVSIRRDSSFHRAMPMSISFDSAHGLDTAPAIRARPFSW